MLHRVLLKGFVSRTCVKGYNISKVTTCHWVVCRVLLQGFVSRVTAYQGLQHVTGWCIGCLWKGMCQGLQHIKDYNLSVDGAAITLQKMGWIICRYIRGKIRGKSVKSIKIHGKSVSPMDISVSPMDISFTDTDTNGYGFIHILAFAYQHYPIPSLCPPHLPHHCGCLQNPPCLQLLCYSFSV
jgi:hypothetical protein